MSTATSTTHYTMTLGDLTQNYLNNSLAVPTNTLTPEEKTRILENLLQNPATSEVLSLTIEDHDGRWEATSGSTSVLTTLLEAKGLLPGVQPLTLTGGTLDGMKWSRELAPTHPKEKVLTMAQRVHAKRYKVAVTILHK